MEIINPTMHKLSAEHLVKSYKRRQVVADVSLSLSTGEIVGLLGPNGAGKTTCFYMMVGLISADNGKVFLNETDITYFPIHQRARMGIGYLPQEASIFRKLTAEKNIKAVLELRKDLNKQKQNQMLEDLLDEFHIKHIRDVQGISLSGGERRRVEIARALAMKLKFILLDEPFAGIDPISVVDIKNIITHLSNRNIGILITDHNVRETLDICQRAYILHEGHTIAEGNPQHILEHEKVREVYLGDE